MTPPPDDDIEALAGEYVLGTLEPGERRSVELALPHDAALRAAVQAWEARLLPLTVLAEPLAPSAQLWPRIEASLAHLARPAALRTDGAPKWHARLNFWRGLAATGFAAAALMLALWLPQQTAAPRYTVVLAAPSNAAPGWVLQASGAGSIKLVPLGPTSVPDDKSLQLWTKADDWKGPVSLGLAKPGETVDVSLAKLPPLQPNQLFEITLEPKTGSPLNRPSGPILYIGRAVRL